jgi:hypothetical protein
MIVAIVTLIYPLFRHWRRQARIDRSSKTPGAK